MKHSNGEAKRPTYAAALKQIIEAPMELYPHLFEPLYIKGLRYRNRIWGSPTAMAMSFLSPEGFLRNEGIEHFRTVPLAVRQW